ncbi:MAG: rhomboid family intramembrane serine protease, partial [Chloroflexi bacterium]|nr:rhomboid family intramembrane serine protease [Chloroflexota bacterium]
DIVAPRSSIRHTASVRQRVEVLWRLTPVVIGLALMWLATGINLLLLHGAWLVDGVRAHDSAGLWPNLVWAPFLHVGLAHLVANTVPFALLGGIIALQSPSRFVAVTIAGALGGALVAWFLGPPLSVHIGASGIVFAYFGWIIVRAVRERSVLAIVIALVTLVVYGGIVWGLSPFQVGISWQDHLGGLLGGMILARAWPVGSKTSTPSSPTLVSPQLSKIGR